MFELWPEPQGISTLARSVEYVEYVGIGGIKLHAHEIWNAVA